MAGHGYGFAAVCVSLMGTVCLSVRKQRVAGELHESLAQCSFSPDGSRIAAVSESGIKLFDCHDEMIEDQGAERHA